MNIENRVSKLEYRIGVNQAPETVEEMFEKLSRGEYGQHTIMDIVVAYRSTPEKTHFFEGLRQHLPGPLVDVFQRRLEKVDAKMMEPDRV